jgi:hypothetical protein
VVEARSDRPRRWSDRQQQQVPVAVEAAVGPPAPWQNGNPRGTGSSAGMGATLPELSYRNMSKLLVRQGDTVKGKSISSKTTYRETMMLLVERSRH